MIMFSTVYMKSGDEGLKNPILPEGVLCTLREIQLVYVDSEGIAVHNRSVFSIHTLRAYEAISTSECKNFVDFLISRAPHLPT